MKVFLFFLLTLTGSTLFAEASTIHYSTKPHSYDRWPDQMEGIVAAEEDALSNYLGKELECRLVQLQFNNHRSPTLFKTGVYNLTLSAECNKSFSDFKMGVVYGYSLGEPIELNLSYNINGKLVKKAFVKVGNDD